MTEIRFPCTVLNLISGIDMNELDLIKSAYDCLGRVTPLATDCGRLCAGACCRGDGEIWLLPGEEALFESADGFEVKTYPDGDTRVICKQSCAAYRNRRPYYCRIFPYFPRVCRQEDNSLSVRLFIDPRAAGLCPFAAGGISPDRRFVKAVRCSVRKLCESDIFYEHFLECAQFLDEMGEFSARLFGEGDR